jgi:threonine synthase
MTSLFSHVICLSCGNEMPPDPMLSVCTQCDGGWLDARYDYDQLNWPASLSKRPTTLWRYEELLPLTDKSYRVSMGEGWTPIVRAEGLGESLGHPNLFLKDERQSPTGSFKDRQGSLSVSVLKQYGIKECVLASTGNAAAAYAAYCARAGIKLWVFLTSMVPAEKMRELGLYGAEVVKVTGTYDQAKKVAADFAERRGIYFDRGARGVPGKESMKTMAYEIAEQLGLELGEGEKWIAPDWFLQAVSGGIGPLGVQKGFQELYAMGMIDKVPKLAIVQAEGCAPMVQAFEKGLAEAIPVIPATRITVLATGDPGKSYTMLRESILQYGGAMTSVDDGQTFRAMRRIARTEGYSVEPATAVAFAGLEKLIALGTISSDETVLINCSGHTFPAEKHILEDQYVLELELGTAAPHQQVEGLGAALERLDEQITTVVVIDDNPNDSRLIRRLLQANKNYRVFEANNPLDGLDIVRQRQPDLVISDLTMPDLDGFTLLDQLKKDPETAHIPVIVLSGKSLTQADRARLDGQIESVWTKGNFKTRDLVDHVVITLKDQVPDQIVEGDAEPIVRSSMPLEQPAEQAAILGGNGDATTLVVEGLRKILVVDDNPYDSRLVKRMLEAGKQFAVSEVHSGEGALLTIGTQHPDLVILDMMLPDMSGLDVLQRIREDDATRNIKVAILSAKDLTEAERKRLDNAVFWQKGTLDRRKLLEAVEAQLG